MNEQQIILKRLSNLMRQHHITVRSDGGDVIVGVVPARVIGTIFTALHDLLPHLESKHEAFPIQFMPTNGDSMDCVSCFDGRLFGTDVAFEVVGYSEPITGGVIPDGTQEWRKFVGKEGGLVSVGAAHIETYDQFQHFDRVSVHS